MPGHYGHALVTLNGSVQNLGTLVNAKDGAYAPDTAILTLELQPAGANSGVVRYGGSSDLSDTNYGGRLEVPVSNVPQAPYRVIGDMPGPVDTLSDIYVIGTNNDKLAVFFRLAV